MQVRLSDDEFAEMESRRGPLSRGGFFRELLRKELEQSTGPPAEQKSGIPSHEECLAILAQMGRDGRVAAAIHFVKVLGEEEQRGGEEPQDWLDELAPRRDNGGYPRSFDRQSAGNQRGDKHA